LPEAEYRRFYLGADADTLSPKPADTEETVAYDSLGSGPGPHRATFEVTFDETTEIVGHAVASLHISAPDADDLDVFVALFKLDADGNHVRRHSLASCSRRSGWRCTTTRSTTLPSAGSH
jgi:predicted acyl esterase